MQLQQNKQTGGWRGRGSMGADMERREGDDDVREWKALETKWKVAKVRTSIGKDLRRSPGSSKSDSSTPGHVSTLHRKKWGMLDGHFRPASLLDLLMGRIVVKQIAGHAFHGKRGLGLHGVLSGLEVDENWVAVYTAELPNGLALLADHLQWS